MPNINRRAVTLRFNLSEQEELNSLCRFYNLDVKQIMKLAIGLMVESTKQVEKIKKEKADEDSKKNIDNSITGSNPSGGDNNPVPESGSAEHSAANGEASATTNS